MEVDAFRPSGISRFGKICFSSIVGVCLAFLLVAHVHASDVKPAAPVSADAHSTSSGAMEWSQLGDADKNNLAPLASQWPKMLPNTRRKWLRISKQYAKMSPGRQARLQQRMKEWVSMTPAQRRQARENYAKSKSDNAAARLEQWKRYQALPPEQKEALAARAKQEHRGLTTIPSRTVKSLSAKPPSSPPPSLETTH